MTSCQELPYSPRVVFYSTCHSAVLETGGAQILATKFYTFHTLSLCVLRMELDSCHTCEANNLEASPICGKFYIPVSVKPEGRGFDSWWGHWNFSLT